MLSLDKTLSYNTVPLGNVSAVFILHPRLHPRLWTPCVYLGSHLLKCIYRDYSLEAQMVKKLPAMWETQVGSLGREDQIPWRRKWQPTPVFLPVEFHGQRCLDSYSPWGFKESDTTERLTYTHTHTHTHTPLRWPPKFHYRLGGVPIRIPIYFFIEIHKLIQTFTWKF